MISSEMKNCHILLVDDEQSELDAYSLLLTSMGIKHVVTQSDSRRVSARLPPCSRRSSFSTSTCRT